MMHIICLKPSKIDMHDSNLRKTNYSTIGYVMPSRKNVIPVRFCVDLKYHRTFSSYRKFQNPRFQINILNLRKFNEKNNSVTILTRKRIVNGKFIPSVKAMNYRKTSTAKVGKAKMHW